MRPHYLDVIRRLAIASGIGEVRAVVGEHRVNAVGHGGGDVAQEVASDPTGGLLALLDNCELGRPVDRDQQVELALFGSHLGQIDVKVADGVRLELRSHRLVAIDIGQPADAVALQAAARQMRDCRLQSVQAVVQWQQRVASECHYDCFLLDR